MKSTHKQKGMTGIGWLLVVSLIIFVFLIVIKLMPAYLDQFNVSSVLSSFSEQSEVRDMTAGEITSKLLKNLDINMVKDVTADDIYVSQAGNHRIIEIEYDVQRKLFANIDILIHFSNRAEVPLR
ncbi:MAG: DUF4845 domain-containing protein [Gammaproteobacteria bacterium]|nr:DUF4845 domain-containing protein [Gammaproteobacteria bacterium]